MAKTLVDIKEELLERAGTATGLKKKVDIVNYALEQLVRQKELEGLMRRLAGNVHWRGNLGKMRRRGSMILANWPSRGASSPSSPFSRHR